MISYATFGVKDKAVSLKFFEPVLGALGYQKFWEGDTHVGFAVGGDPSGSGTIWLGPPFNGEEAVASNGSMIGLHAPSRAAVRAFHEAALANGGACEGPPGIREAYGPNVYMAYVRDPVGNKFSAMCTAEDGEL
jgi:catechol 2,3-dioxygenase-like lactoylglutathione lyase family enzyme